MFGATIVASLNLINDNQALQGTQRGGGFFQSGQTLGILQVEVVQRLRPNQQPGQGGLATLSWPQHEYPAMKAGYSWLRFRPSMGRDRPTPRRLGGDQHRSSAARAHLPRVGATRTAHEQRVASEDVSAYVKAETIPGVARLRLMCPARASYTDHRSANRIENAAKGSQCTTASPCPIVVGLSAARGAPKWRRAFGAHRPSARTS